MNTGAFLLGLPILCVGAILAALLRSNRTSAIVAITSQTAASLLVVYGVLPVVRGAGVIELSWTWPAPVENVVLRIDGLSAFFLVWSLPMTLLGTVYASEYLRPYYKRGRHGGPHFALLNLVSVSFVLIYSVQNALVFLLGWEIAAIAAWLLVIWDYRVQKVRFAGFNYLVSTHIGLFILVAAFMLLHANTRSMDFAAFGQFLSKPGEARGAIFVLLGLSFALKSAFFPLHTWLPRAHAAAPAQISALMSGVIHKAGLFGFLRFTQLMGRPEEWMGWSVLGFGALSAFFGVLYSATQRDLKRLLGYSSTENVGIAAIGFGVGCLGWTWNVPNLAALGFAAGLLHVLNHALFKCLLFYAAGSVSHATGSVDLEKLGGLAKRLPHTAGLFLIGALASCGLPPFNCFISELMIYAGLLSGLGASASSNIVLTATAAALAFSGAVGCLSMSRAFGVCFLGSTRDAGLRVGHEAPPAMLGPMWLHASGVVLLGLAPGLVWPLVGGALRPFPMALHDGLRLVPIHAFVTAGRVLSLALLAALVLSWLRGLHARRSVTWGCGYTLASARIQYTATSFAEHFSRIFTSFVPEGRRERLPSGLMPRQSSQLATHHADAVEQRLFESLSRAEKLVSRVAGRISEQPRVAFAAGLFTIVIATALSVFGGADR